jgi:hypothetical protein
MGALGSNDADEDGQGQLATLVANTCNERVLVGVRDEGDDFYQSEEYTKQIAREQGGER